MLPLSTFMKNWALNTSRGLSYDPQLHKSKEDDQLTPRKKKNIFNTGNFIHVDIQLGPLLTPFPNNAELNHSRLFVLFFSGWKKLPVFDFLGVQPVLQLGWAGCNYNRGPLYGIVESHTVTISCHLIDCILLNDWHHVRPRSYFTRAGYKNLMVWCAEGNIVDSCNVYTHWLISVMWHAALFHLLSSVPWHWCRGC